MSKFWHPINSQWDIDHESMIGENRHLLTDEPVEVQDCKKITDKFKVIIEYTQFNKGKLKDVNMYSNELANTEISTDYAQKSP